MPMPPKLAGGGAGLPHEFPKEPRAVGQNDKFLLSLVKAGSVDDVLRFRGALARDPDAPGRGTAQLYIFDDGAAVELRVRYNDDGTVKSGSVALA